MISKSNGRTTVEGLANDVSFEYHAEERQNLYQLRAEREHRRLNGIEI